MDILVAVDKKWGIGKEGRLLASLRTDQVRFRTLTLNQVVIYGRKTLESFPETKPLPGRKNIILSRNIDFRVDGALMCHDLANLPQMLALCGDKKIWVIGGDNIYRQLLPYCSRAFVTYIDRQYPADRFFPNLDRLPDWKLLESGQWQTDINRLSADKEEVRFCYQLYEQQAVAIDALNKKGAIR